MTKIALFFVCFLILFGSAYGQQGPISFQRLYSKDGLSSNTVYALCRDSFGFLWIGTEDGLNRFDGSNYKIYRRNPSDTDGLGVNHITALFEDKKGRLWIGTNGGGIALYDRKTDLIQHYEPDDLTVVSAAINSISGDSKGNIWITSYGAIYCLDVETGKFLTNENYSKIRELLEGKISSCTFTDKNSHLWIAADQQIYQYNPDLNLVQIHKIGEIGSVKRSEPLVHGIEEDDLGNLWFGTTDGLYRLDQGRNGLVKLEDLKNGRHLLSDNVYTVAIDSANKLWIGTDKGLHILDVNDFVLDVYKPEKGRLNSISTNSIRTILIDDYGIYWVGTYQGGLNKYDQNLNQFNLRIVQSVQPYAGESTIVTSFASVRDRIFVGTDAGGIFSYDKRKGNLAPLGKSNDLPPELTVLAMEPDDDVLWLGTYQSGLYAYNIDSKAYTHFAAGMGDNQLNNDEIFCLKKDSKGRLWIGTNGGGVNVLSKDQNSIIKYETVRYIRAIEESYSGRMWVGTYGAGITTIDPATGRFDNMNVESHNLPSNYVLSIHEDRQGNIWVGTNGDGVGLLTKDSSKFQRISVNDGLLNGVVQHIIQDDSGKIWFSTGQGLSCYDTSSKSFKNYSHSSGLQSGSFSLGAGLKTSDGELFFGGQQGFNHFYPQNLKANQNPARVVLTNLRINNVEVDPHKDGPISTSLLLAEKINLAHNQNFSISFEALNFTVPEDNQYEYMLDGFDQKWMPVGKEHIANYTNISPGRYIFRVRASNNDGIWDQNERSIEIFVAPPWWRTIYAYLFYVLGFVGSLFLIRARGIRKLKAQFVIEQERNKANQLIEQERKEAEQLRNLDKMKIKFLTNLSHEFRTPISLITGPIDNMLRKMEGGKMSDQLSLVKRNAQRLLSLVDQLLDFRKMEEKEIALQNSPGELISFVKETIASFNDLAQQKRIDFSFQCECEELEVNFDEDKIERILFNLLSNAFKFTPAGGFVQVVLCVDGLEKTEDHVRVVFNVKDSGVGIPHSHRKKVFESFFQLDTGSQFLNQGSGIGLSIVESFVHLYNGKIEVESVLGEGSNFIFDLLLSRCTLEKTDKLTDAHDEPLDKGVGQSDYGRPKILIIEDDLDFRVYLKEHLHETYQIIEAEHGKEGWQKALFSHPDIIISDVQMPIMDGVELAQKLHNDKRTKHIPVILLTAAHIPNGMIYGLESGAIDYINKPFDIQLLKAKVDSLLMLNQAFKDTYVKQVTVATPEIEVVSENEKFLQKVMAYIEENIANSQLSVEALSGHLSISRASLYNRLLEYTGMTPVEFIRATKLDRAKQLLDKSDKTIGEIAYEMGFANPNYFTKVFKLRYKQTPSEYLTARRNQKLDEEIFDE